MCRNLANMSMSINFTVIQHISEILAAAIRQGRLPEDPNFKMRK